MSYYDARVKIDGDDSALQEKIQKANNQVAQTDQSLDRQNLKIHQLWSYGMHITRLIVSNLSKVAQTESEEMRIKEIQQMLSIAETQASIAYTGYRAGVAFATQQYGQGTFLVAIAALMQTQLVQRQAQYMEQKRLTQYQKNVAKFYEMYR